MDTNDSSVLTRRRLFYTEAGTALATTLSRELGIPLGQQTLKTFADGELYVEICEDVAGADVLLVSPTNPPAENFLSTLLLANALRNSGAVDITLVLPYVGYNRQDAALRIGQAQSAKIILTALGAAADRIIVIDLHAPHTLNFLGSTSVTHVSAAPLLVSRLGELLLNPQYLIVSPDQGSSARAAEYANLLGNDNYATGTKSRSAHNHVSQITFDTDCKDKMVVLVDDMIDTGGTMIAAAEAAKLAGATEVIAIATHGLFSDDAARRIDESSISHILTTDTIPFARQRAAAFQNTIVEILSVTTLLAGVILNTNSTRQ